MHEWGQFNLVFYASGMAQSHLAALLPEDKIGRGDLWTIILLPRLTPLRLSSRDRPCDHHVIIWTNQSPANVLRLSPCVNVKLSHVYRCDRKLLMPVNLNMGVHDT